MDSRVGDAAVSHTSPVRAGWLGLWPGRAGRAVVAAGTGTGAMKMAGQWNDTALTSGLRFAGHFARDNSSYREQNGGLTMRAPLTRTRDRRSGRGCRVLPDDEREPSPVSARDGTECGRVMGYLEESPTPHEHPDSAHHMPGAELRSSARRHSSARAPLTHLLDHESPPGPRRPSESFPSSPGRSSSASDHRASRLSAGTSRSRAAVRRLAAGLLLVAAFLSSGGRRTGADHPCVQHRAKQFASSDCRT